MIERAGDGWRRSSTRWCAAGMRGAVSARCAATMQGARIAPRCRSSTRRCCWIRVATAATSRASLVNVHLGAPDSARARRATPARRLGRAAHAARTGTSGDLSDVRLLAGAGLRRDDLRGVSRRARRSRWSRSAPSVAEIRHAPRGCCAVAVAALASRRAPTSRRRLAAAGSAGAAAERPGRARGRDLRAELPARRRARDRERPAGDAAAEVQVETITIDERLAARRVQRAGAAAVRARRLGALCAGSAGAAASTAWRCRMRWNRRPTSGPRPGCRLSAPGAVATS